MRKLNKTDLLALEYKNWEDAIPKGTNHPGYNSSKGRRFYYDIIANLIWVQKGLCAYTEYKLQDFDKCAAAYWQDARFSKFDFAGELDHYDPSLKQNQAWLWDNFFLIDSDVNSKKVKGSKSPKGILKPDKGDFDPHFYLEYNIDEHFFKPSPERTIQEQQDIFHDITVLGLNWQPTVERRKAYLLDKIIDVTYQKLTYDEAYGSLYQFFTAFELCKQYMLD